MRWINAHKRATAFIVIAVLAVSGTWLARGSGGGASVTDPTATTSTVGGPATAALAGSTDSGTVTSSEASEGPSTTLLGSSRLDIPVDPSGSRQGRDEAAARQVAIDYLSTVKQRVMYMAPADGAALLAAWAAPGVAPSELDDTVARFGQLRDALTAAGGDVWWVVSPLAVKVEAFAADRARVSVWTATVMASGAARGVDATVAAPQVAYRTGSVELLWEDDAGWSVWSITEAPGPVPMAAADQSPAGPAEFLAALSGFSLIKEHR